MFTGIIRHVGLVRSVKPASGGAGLRIDLGPLSGELAGGDSVAVNGVCLTVSALVGKSAQADFDVIAETLSRTTLGQLRAGSKVNLERALSVTGRLDGHLVQGHVDGVASVRSIGRAAGGVWQFACSRELARQMTPKGSVAVNGVSLTLVDVAEERFSVALIPTTLSETTLGELVVGDRVNIETDVIGKYVLRYLSQMTDTPGRLTMDQLRRAGFV